MKHLKPFLFRAALLGGLSWSFALAEFVPLPGAPSGGFVAGGSGSILVGGVVDPETTALVPQRWVDRTPEPLTLGTDFGSGFAQAANASGTVVGQAWPILFGPGPLPVVWEAGTIRALPTLGLGGRATGINSLGEIIGAVEVPGGERPAVWRNGVLTVLPIPTLDPTAETFASAVSINDAGQISGSAKVAFGADSTALRWENDVLVPVVLEGLLETRGAQLRSDGSQLVDGFLPNGSDRFNAVVKPDGTLEFLQEPLGALTALTIATNDAGDTVGYAAFFGDEPGLTLLPVRWRGTEVAMLPLPEGFEQGYPTVLGPDGSAAGYVGDRDTGFSVPGVWESTAMGPVSQAASARSRPSTPATLTATVVRDGRPVAGAPVRFLLNGRQIGRGTTDAQGVARAAYTPPLTHRAGSFQLMSSMGGGRYARSVFTVEWIPTRMTLPEVGGTPDQTVTVRGRLLRDLATTQGAPGLPIRLRIGPSSMNATTNGSGFFTGTFTIPAGAARGRVFAVRAEYPGNANHRASTTTSKVVVR